MADHSKSWRSRASEARITKVMMRADRMANRRATRGSWRKRASGERITKVMNRLDRRINSGKTKGFAKGAAAKRATGTRSLRVTRSIKSIGMRAGQRGGAGGVGLSASAAPKAKARAAAAVVRTAKPT